MLKIKLINLNIDTIFKLTILLGFSLFFFISIQSGRVLSYVHPRIVPYMKFCIAAMLLIAFFILGNVFKPQKGKANVASYLFFIIPLIMAFSLPAKDMNSGSMTLENLNVAGQIAATSLKDDDVADGDSLKLHEDTVIMDDRNFVQWMQEISNNLSKYEGKRIQVTGFVFKDNKFKSDEFVAARLMMVCCAADMTPVGLLARYNKAYELKQDSWFRFTGKISEGKFQGQQMPVIDIESIERIGKPKNDYVYPY